MISSIFILFSLISITSLIFIDESKHRYFFLYAIAIILILISGLRQPGIDLDYYNYEYSFKYGSSFNIRFEPAFFLIQSSIKFISDNPKYFFLAYAFLGVGIKFFSIKNLSKLWYLSILVYLSHYFILHEITQIRAGVASAISLYSIIYIYERNFKKFLLLSIIALSFHYSAIVFFPLYLLNPKAFNKVKYLLIIFTAFILGFIGVRFGYFVGFIPIPEIQNLFSMYAKDVVLGAQGQLNLVSIPNLIKTCVIFLMIYNLDSISRANKYAYLLIKIYILSLISFIFFSDIPGIGFRISEFFGLVEILIIPFFVYFFRFKLLGILTVIFYCAYLFWSTFYFQKLILL